MDWLAPWDSYYTAIENVVDRGDRVLVQTRDQGRRKDLAAAVELLGTAVYTVRDGKVARIEYYSNRDEALEAVGLSEQGPQAGLLTLRDTARAMSQENVEIALAVVDAVARMDGDRLIELTHPEVEWHSFLAQLGEGGVYRGHAGMREYAQDLRDAWDVYSAEVQDALAVGELVVLVSQLRYRGKGSGVDTESPAGHMVKFREGRVIHMRSFREPEAALEAIGLSKQDAHADS